MRREFSEFWYVVKDLINFSYYWYYLKNCFSFSRLSTLLKLTAQFKMFLCIGYRLWWVISVKKAYLSTRACAHTHTHTHTQLLYLLCYIQQQNHLVPFFFLCLSLLISKLKNSFNTIIFGNLFPSFEKFGLSWPWARSLFSGCALLDECRQGENSYQIIFPHLWECWLKSKGELKRNLKRCNSLSIKGVMSLW